MLKLSHFTSQTLLIIFSSFIICGPAANSQSGEWRKHCKGEVEQFCKKVKATEWRIGQCLVDHEPKLSTRCKQSRRYRGFTTLDNYRSRVCQKDIERLCPGIPNENGKLRACLFENAEKITYLCEKNTHWLTLYTETKAAGLAEGGSSLTTVTKRACRSDIERYCKEAKPKIRSCLEKHKNRVSLICQREL